MDVVCSKYCCIVILCILDMQVSLSPTTVDFKFSTTAAHLFISTYIIIYLPSVYWFCIFGLYGYYNTLYADACMQGDLCL